MARRKFVRKEPKYKVFSITTKVLTLENITYAGEKCKTVFDCESPTGTPRRCIYWQFKDNPTKFQVGDEVLLTGRLENGVFLVYKLLYVPSKRQNEAEQ